MPFPKPPRKVKRSTEEILVGEIHLAETMVERRAPTPDEVERWVALTLPLVPEARRRAWAERTSALCRRALRAAKPLPPPVFGTRAALERWARADPDCRRAVLEVLDLMRKSHERCGRQRAAAAFVSASSVLFQDATDSDDRTCDFRPSDVGPASYSSPDDARREARGLADASPGRADAE